MQIQPGRRNTPAAAEARVLPRQIKEAAEEEQEARMAPEGTD